MEMIEYHFSDEEYNGVIKEAEELKLKKMEEETKKTKNIAEANRIFEGISHRIESGKALFDIPPRAPSPSPIAKAKGKNKEGKDNHRTATSFKNILRFHS